MLYWIISILLGELINMPKHQLEDDNEEEIILNKRMRRSPSSLEKLDELGKDIKINMNCLSQKDILQRENSFKPILTPNSIIINDYGFWWENGKKYQSPRISVEEDKMVVPAYRVSQRSNSPLVSNIKN
jgi:hypothetical protein